MLKICKTCKEEKHIDNYSKQLDGKQPNCKICDGKRALANYHTNRERCIAANKAYKKANADKIKIQRDKYKQENKEALQEYQQKYKSINATTIKEKAKLWYEQTKPIRKEKARTYYQTEAGIVSRAANEAKRRAKLAAPLSELDWFVLLEAQRLAKLRGQLLGTKWHVDHIIPVSLGGTNEYTNIQVVPAAWNLKKGNRNSDRFFDAVPRQQGA
jgi:5-methylcytosine-specific restriction endonuclease McrA